MVEKTDRPKKASKRGQAGKTAKPAAKKPKKSATKKPVAEKRRKRAAKAVAEGLNVSKEELAARRISGGQDAAVAAAAAPVTQPPSGAQTPAAAKDDGAAAAPDSIPSEPAPEKGQAEVAARSAKSGKRDKTEPRTRAGENTDGGLRPNTLVPTNGIHTTQRRLKRKFHQNRGVMGLIAATLVGIFILGEQTPPPNLADFEREIAASQAIDSYVGSRVANSPPGIVKPKLRHELVSIPGPGAGRVSERRDKNLNAGELIEMERLLARLDLGPSTADGIVDNQTEAAIRLYQEIAGLTVDGAPSRSLLADIREVVKILKNGG